MRILFAAPAWWPAVAFGGPIPVARELVRGLVARGHAVEVVTTTLEDVGRPAARRTRVAELDGARVHYLGTPFRYRWMGVTPTLPIELERLARPDVVHVFGFRDVVTTGAAAWARLRRIPYVLEPLGMFRPRLRKVALKRGLDATLYRGVAGGAAVVVVASGRERDEVVACAVPPGKVRVRRNGFPQPVEAPPARGPLRRDLGIRDSAPVVLYAGRIAAGKGIELLLAAVRELDGVHLVLAGPDDRHGAIDLVRAAQREVGLAGRIHVLGPQTQHPTRLLAEADVLALPSAGESFGMAAAEAAAAGVPVVLTDRCGVAGCFHPGEAVVVPYEAAALRDGLARVLADPELRARLAAGGRAAARRMSWRHVVELQDAIYREAVASRTAATNASTEGS